MKLRQRRCYWRRSKTLSKQELSRLNLVHQWNVEFARTMERWSGTFKQYGGLVQMRKEPVSTWVVDTPARLHTLDYANLEARIIAYDYETFPASGPDTGRLSGNRK